MDTIMDAPNGGNSCRRITFPISTRVTPWNPRNGRCLSKLGVAARIGSILREIIFLVLAPAPGKGSDKRRIAPLDRGSLIPDTFPEDIWHKRTPTPKATAIDRHQI